MENIRQKLRRTLSVHDKNPNFDEHEEVDEETTGHMHKDIEEAEEGGFWTGKPGSFLNRLINHGNKKTEEEINRETSTSS